MNTKFIREPARQLFNFGLVVICALAAADLLGLPGGASVGMLLMILGTPFWLNSVMARRSTMFDPGSKGAITVILIAASLLSLLAILSAVYAVAPMRVARTALAMGAAVAMASFVAGTLTRDRLIPLLNTIIGSIAAVSVLSIAGYLVPGLADAIFAGGDRAHGTFKNPNQYGIVISLAAPIAAGLVLAETGRNRIYAASCLGILLIGLVLSGSKANLLLTGMTLSTFSLLIVGATFRGPKRIAALLLTLLGIVIAMTCAVLILQALNPRAVTLLSAFFNADQSVPSLNSRALIWERSWDIYSNRPWTGEGAGQVMFPTITHSHNLLLEYARTLGTLGLLTVAVLIITIVVMLVTTVLGTMLYAPDRKSLRPLLIGLALSSGSYVLANMSSESFGPSTTPFFWLILFTFFAVRAETLKERGSARSRVLKQVRRVVRPSEINGPANV